MEKIEIFNKDIHTVDYRKQYEDVRVDASDLICIDGRQTESLDGQFNFSPDPYETCLRAHWYEEKTIAENGLPIPQDSDFEGWPTIPVPSCWNTERPELYYYENLGLYFRTFDYKPHENDERVFLHFEGSFYRTYVFLNGKKAGMHDGGSTPFSIEVTDLLQEKNRLVIAVDASRSKDRIPMDNTDWFNYGGIYRDLLLVRTPRQFIKDWFTYLVPSDYSKVAVEVQMDGTVDGTVRYQIPELSVDLSIPVKDGKGSAEIACSPTLWSPENPKRYAVVLSYGADEVSDKIGFRDVRVDGLSILVNGKPTILKGVSVHEDHVTLGKTTNESVIRETIADLKEMNGNFLRLAHYPHTRLFSRIADELGVLLWEEIPVYWAINFTNEETYRDAENQLTELIKRDRNRASVIIWSVGNENPDTDARLKFMSSLARQAKKLDRSRLVSAACLVNTNKLKLEDRLMEYLDVIGNNEYYGWYEPDFDDLLKILDNTRLTKPVIITEFGGGAKAGNHGTKETMWTEEFQADLYRKQFATLDKCKYVKGMTPWIFYDFRAVRRLNRYQQGFNRKGLIDSDRKTRKLAYYVTQAYYGSRQ
jgi:beta-glucuronidase